jgi:hypothetical protein
MRTAPASEWRRFSFRLVLAVLVLSAAAAGVSLLSGLIPDQLEMILAGALTILVPGWAVAGYLGIDEDRGSVVAWGLVPLIGVAVWAPPGLLGLLIGVPFAAIAIVVLLATAVCVAMRPPMGPPPVIDSAAMLVLGGLGAVLGWQWQSTLIGDALFHTGVIRKLLALDRPDERTIWPILHGHPHAGYAFPLLHLPQAAAIRVAGLDVSVGYADLAPFFALMLPLVAYAVGYRVNGRVSGCVTALVAMWFAITGELVLSTAQQPRYYVTLVALPAVLLLVLEQIDRPSIVTATLLVTGVLVITVCHLTYTPPLLAALVVLALLNPELWRPTLVACGASIVVFGVIYLTAVHGSTPNTAALIPPGSFVRLGDHRIALSGFQIFNHRAEGVLALCAAIWGVRRPRTPLGILSILTAVIYLVCTIPGVTPALALVVGPGQAHRYEEMLPWPYVLGPAIVLLARSRYAWAVIAAAAVASFVLERADLLIGNAATGIAFLGAIVLVIVAVRGIARSRRHRRPEAERPDGGGNELLVGLAALVLGFAVLVGSVSEHAHAVASSFVDGRPQPTVGDRLSPGVLSYFRSQGQPLPVVLAPFGANEVNWYSGIAYELVGAAPVYAVALSTFHTQSERKDHPRARRADVKTFLDPATSQAERHAILERWDVTHVVVDLRAGPPALLRQLDADPALRRVYEDPPSPSDYARLRVYEVR